jgi:Flp pilus assembly protein TadG
MEQAFRLDAEAADGERTDRDASCGGPSLLRRIRQLADDTSGSSVVEFAILVWPFILLIFGALQITLIIFMNQMLQTAAVQSGRIYMTGQADGDNQAQFTQVVYNHLPALFNHSLVTVNLQSAGSASALAGDETTLTPVCTTTPPITCTIPSAFTPSSPYAPGTPQQYVILRVLYQLPLMGGGFGFSNMPNGSYLMAGTSVFAVEPYPSS